MNSNANSKFTLFVDVMSMNFRAVVLVMTVLYDKQRLCSNHIYSNLYHLKMQSK